MLNLLGKEVTVNTQGENLKTKAIILPMRYKNKLYIDMGHSELGFKDSECFLYLGSPDVDFTGFEMQTFIKTADRSYNVSRADRINIGDSLIYIWAVLTPRIKENAYDIN